MIPTFEKKMNVLEYKMIFKAYMDSEREAEVAFNKDKAMIIERLENKFG